MYCSCLFFMSGCDQGRGAGCSYGPTLCGACRAIFQVRGLEIREISCMMPRVVEQLMSQVRSHLAGSCTVFVAGKYTRVFRRPNMLFSLECENPLQGRPRLDSTSWAGHLTRRLGIQVALSGFVFVISHGRSRLAPRLAGLRW